MKSSSSLRNLNLSLCRWSSSYLNSPIRLKLCKARFRGSASSRNRFKISCSNSMSILPEFKVVRRLSPCKSSNYSISYNNWMSSLKKMPCRRSEEHTSELQSRENLVCRLLLEKKKKKNKRQDGA